MAHTERTDAHPRKVPVTSSFHKGVFLAVTISVVVIVLAILFFVVKKPNPGSPQPNPGTQQREKGVATP